MTAEMLAQTEGGHDLGIVHLIRPERFRDLEGIFALIYELTDKVRVGGCPIIPKSTYGRIPYSAEGTKLLAQVMGMEARLWSRKSHELVICVTRQMERA